MTVRVKAKDQADAVYLAERIRGVTGDEFSGVFTDTSEEQLVFVMSEEIAEKLTATAGGGDKTPYCGGR